MASEPTTPTQLTGLDGFFANTNIVLLIILSICCSGIAFILGLIGIFTCKDAKAKQNAIIVTIIGLVSGGGWVIGSMVRGVMGH
jgi:hypothetical protein